MDIHAACASILGDELAHSITMSMGVHWCVVAAMAEARTSDNPAALATIRSWVAAKRRLGSYPVTTGAKPLPQSPTDGE